MCLAIVWGSRKIVFLGLDMQLGKKSHWHGDHEEPLRNTSVFSYPNFADNFVQAAPQLKAMGVTVINASRNTALDCFPRMSIQDALPENI